jgi:hypothetical protein
LPATRGCDRRSRYGTYHERSLSDRLPKAQRYLLANSFDISDEVVGVMAKAACRNIGTW